MSSPVLLDYGQTPRRRWRRWVVWGVLIAIAGLAAYRYRQPVQQWATDRLAHYRHTRAFDHAVASLFPDGQTLWIAPPGDPAGGQARDDLFQPSWSSQPLSGDAAFGRVRFAYRGQTAGRDWIAFGHADFTQITVWSFLRDDRHAGVAEAPLQIDGSYDFRWSDRLDVANAFTVSVVGDVARLTPVSSDGSSYVDVRVASTRAVQPRSPMGAAATFVKCTATTHGGWQTDDVWWPQRDIPMLEGPPATRAISLPDVPTVAAFAPDGRIVVLTRTSIAWVNPDDGTIEWRDAPDLAAHAPRALSPDARWCLLADRDGEVLAQPTSGGPAMPLGKVENAVRADFIDDHTVDLIAPEGARRFDLASGQEIDRPVETPSLQRENHTHTRESLLLLPQNALSPGARWLVSTNESELAIFDTTTGLAAWRHLEPTYAWPTPPIDWPVRPASFSADGSAGAIRGGDWAFVWHLAAPRSVRRVPLPRDCEPILSRDGRRLAAYGYDPMTRSGSLHVWDALAD